MGASFFAAILTFIEIDLKSFFNENLNSIFIINLLTHLFKNEIENNTKMIRLSTVIEKKNKYTIQMTCKMRNIDLLCYNFLCLFYF